MKNSLSFLFLTVVVFLFSSCLQTGFHTTSSSEEAVMLNTLDMDGDGLVRKNTAERTGEEKQLFSGKAIETFGNEKGLWIDI